MAKFEIHRGWEREFVYRIEADNEDAALDAYYQGDGELVSEEGLHEVYLIVKEIRDD